VRGSILTATDGSADPSTCFSQVVFCIWQVVPWLSEVVFDVWEVVSTDFGSCTLPNKTCTLDEAPKSIVVARKLVSIWLVHLKSCTIFDM
jgi:hypothetical protein